MSRRQVLSLLCVGGGLGLEQSLFAQGLSAQEGTQRSLAAASTPDGNVARLPEPKGAAIDTAVQAYLSDYSVPGVALSVIKGSEVVYRKGYGTTQVGRNHPPDAQTIFQINSITKVFTAFAVLCLHDQRRLDIAKMVGEYLSVLPNPDWKDIRVSELLSMSGGLPTASSTTATYQQILEQVARKETGYKTGLDFEPGTRVEYSNANFFLLGALVDAVSPQRSFDLYTRQTFLKTLRMRDTGLLPFGTGERYCTPYDNGKALQPRAPLCGYSGGGFASTIADMEKFAMALHARRILKPETYDLMWTPQKLKSGTLSGWGLGWNLQRDSAGKTVRASKDGAGFGWTTMLVVYPQAAVSVVILTNSGGRIAPLAFEIGKMVG